MTQEQQALHFGTELHALTKRYADEYDFMAAAMVGLLVIEANKWACMMNGVEFRRYEPGHGPEDHP